MNWQRLYNNIFKVSLYPREIDRYIAFVTYVTASLIFVTYLFYAIVAVDWPSTASGVNDSTMLELALTQPGNIASLVFYALFLLTGLTFALVRRGYLQYAVWLPVATWYFVGVLAATLTTDSASFPAASTVIMLLIAGLLVGMRGVPVATLLGLVTIGIRALQEPMFANQAGEPSVISLFMQIIGAGVFIYFFLRINQLNRSEGAAEAAEDQSLTALLLRQIAYGVAERVSPQQLLRDAVERVVKSFDVIYYTQIFLLSEDGTQADLVAASGIEGQNLVNKGYSVPLGTKSIISRVIETGASVIEGSAGASGKNERRDDSQVQIVVPLRIGPKVLGVLDVQSRDIAAFNEASVITMFQALADSLALAIDNVSQYQRAESRLKENERLVKEARDALREVERLNERLIGTAWSSYIQQSNNSLSRAVDFEHNNATADFDMTPTLQGAQQINQLVEAQHEDSQVIAIPLRVRGHVIGAMEFELDKERGFSPEDLELVQEVSERFGMAVENARLVDESQRLARREALVNQITARLQVTNDVDTMLTEATRSLYDTLQARRVSVRLGPPPKNAAQ